jgi:predicted alpha/beta-hydrolase family hydrolase
VLPADPELLINGTADASRTVVLAHGAGAGMDTPFMDFFGQGLSKQGLRVVRFEFPYMASQRSTGTRKPPDRPDALQATWLRVVDRLGAKGLVIGGKSMGGRIASLVAHEAGVAGLIFVGYPLHPVGKPDQLRVEHLRTIKTPMLILQGERDPFGSREEVPGYKLPRKIRVVWLKDGDHSFKPRKSSGRTEQENWQAALDEIERFVANLG